MPAMAASAPAGPTEPNILPVDQIVLPVIEKGRLAGYIMLGAMIELESAGEAERARSRMPRIVDVWLRTMHGLSRRGSFDEAGLDPSLIKFHLLQATRSVLAESHVRDVLITTALFTAVP
jgi:hypothetical protein